MTDTRTFLVLLTVGVALFCIVEWIWYRLPQKTLAEPDDTAFPDLMLVLALLVLAVFLG